MRPSRRSKGATLSSRHPRRIRLEALDDGRGRDVGGVPGKAGGEGEGGLRAGLLGTGRRDASFPIRATALVCLVVGCAANPPDALRIETHAQSVQREVEVELAPGARYRLEASMAPAPCTMRLVRESP